MTVRLRATRSGNENGRTYTMTLQCTDPATNLATTKIVSVAVPHDQGH